MVNGNQPYQQAIKPLTIFYEEKSSQSQGSRRATPQMIVEVQIAFLYRDDKAISWRYECNIVSPKAFIFQDTSTSIVRVSHFTRSRRCYGLDNK